MRCPQFLRISLCKPFELMRYVLAENAIVSVGDIFKHAPKLEPSLDWLLLPVCMHQLHHTFNDAHDNFDSLSSLLLP